ncbi:MAG: hypothetical protein F4Y76_11895 [Acidimicrobiales bacterium]|nr:hypothetical protein [Acidimicrobiales bacterium]MYG60370.1 hypothetical protein [Acidimicrobiales bacterium]
MNIFKHRLRAALRRARRDARGVALQTVIVIVVLLMIAGGVSAVLLSRSSDVVGQLEAQGVGAITEDNCPITRVGGNTGMYYGTATLAGASTGVPPRPEFTALGTTRVCAWDAGDGSSEDVTAAQCFAAGNGKIYRATAAITALTLGGQSASVAVGDLICAAEIG